MSDKKKTYTVQEDAWFGPVFKEKDDEVQMTEAEAEYYVPHVLKLKTEPTQANASKPEPKPPAAKAGAKK